MNNKYVNSINNELIKMRKIEFKDFLKFRRYYFHNYNKYKDSVFHADTSNLLNKISQDRGTKIAIAAPRGSAKSTLVTLQYVIYCICYGVENFIVIISNTSDQAQNFLTDIKRELESNERLIKDFPDICEIGTKPGPPRWTQQEILTKNNVKVIALGVGQQIRGRRNKEHRPSLIILDDIEGNNSAQAPENYYKTQDWLEKSVLKSGVSTTNVVFIGTIHHYGSLLAKYTSEDNYHGWKKKIYRSIINWAENVHLWEEWTNIFCNKTEFNDESGVDAAHKFYEANKTEMMKGVKVLWSECKNYYDLMVQREDEGHISFDSEMQNEPVNPRDCMFSMDDTHYWDDRFGSDIELLDNLKNTGCYPKIFAACDPSLGKQNKKGDYSAIICAAYDTKNKICYIIDTDVERRHPDKIIESIIALRKKREFSNFGFESNGFQSYLADEVEKAAKAAGCPLNIKKITNTSDKRSRIESLQPMIKNGMIQFSKKQRILLEQLKFYPKGLHDDALDALQMVYSLCNQKECVTGSIWGCKKPSVYNHYRNY